MPTITQHLAIAAPIARCFDLSRSIELHKLSTAATGEEAIAGVTSGLIGMGEQVTWRAKHLGVWQTLTSKITAYEYPTYFVDEMVQGAFKSFRHEHLFEEQQGQTLMTDRFSYTSPLGLLGHCADLLFLKRYMAHFLATRCQIIKEFAESDRWREVLHSRN